MITRLDRDVGRICRQAQGARPRREHARLLHQRQRPAQGGRLNDRLLPHPHGPLRGIKRDLYDGGIRVPMIARWPGKIAPAPPPSYVRAFWDFLPTAAELAGADRQAPQEPSTATRSLPTLTGKSQPAPRIPLLRIPREGLLPGRPLRRLEGHPQRLQPAPRAVQPQGRPRRIQKRRQIPPRPDRQGRAVPEGRPHRQPRFPRQQEPAHDAPRPPAATAAGRG